jgi:acetylglutamate kinase
MNKSETSDSLNEYKSPPSGTEGLKLYIIKIGGNVIDSDEIFFRFISAFASIDAKKILIHGGGKIATSIGERLGIQSNYVNGRRITDDATIDIVTMVYGGLVNKKIVAQLQAKGCNAMGLTGADGNLIPATKRVVKDIDYGWVGDIDSSQLAAHSLKQLLDNGFIPVFAPLTHDQKGHILNTNADTIASSIAVALSKLYAVRLIYCFERKGVLENIEEENSVIHLITREKYKQLLNENKLFSGILPKIDNAFAAIEAGVKEVLIGDASDLLQNVTDEITGTLFTE